MHFIKKIHILIIFLLVIQNIPVSAADTAPLLVPSLQAQMIKQEKINKRNMFTERRAQRLIEKQLLLNSNNK
jgi:hypothetical protein